MLCKQTGVLQDPSVLDTFLAGVLADSSGGGSANYVRLLLRSFAVS